MMYPLSLPEEVKGRAFHASNGELGIIWTDTRSFLAACRSDGVTVLGWELWLADHHWMFSSNSLVLATGSRCGGIPVQGSDVPAIIGGEGDVGEVERQLASIDLHRTVQQAWLPYIRVNFTLEN
jgi:hypothetical protein